MGATSTYFLPIEEFPVCPRWTALFSYPSLSYAIKLSEATSHPIMTNQEQNRALRAAILSLQSGLLTILEFLEILAGQSTDPDKFKRHIKAIRESIQQLDELPPLSKPQNEDEDKTSE